MFSEAITEEQLYSRPAAKDGVYAASSFEATSVMAVVAMGFSTDPVARWMYPEPADYFNYFPGFIRSFAGRSFEAGTAFVMEGHEGAALWLKPGFEPDSEALEALFDATIAEEKKPLLSEMFEQMAAFHPGEDHWYLPMIGVETRFQGRGIGSRLMEHALRLCDADGLPAYLESSNVRNIPLYEKFGFTVIGTIRAGSAPPMYPMIRKASGEGWSN